MNRQWALAAATGVALTFGAGCSGPIDSIRPTCQSQPAIGLYKVASRRCENPLQETDYCPLTQYVEIATGDTFGLAGEPKVIVQWFAETAESSDYAYVVEHLGGRCVDDSKYTIEHDSAGDAWLTLHAGVPGEYGYDSFTDDTRKRVLFRARYTLEPAVRTPELDRRLHIARE